MFLLCGDFTERNRNLLGLPLGAWALYFSLYFPHGSLGSNCVLTSVLTTPCLSASSVSWPCRTSWLAFLGSMGAGARWRFSAGQTAESTSSASAHRRQEFLFHLTCVFKTLSHGSASGPGQNASTVWRTGANTKIGGGTPRGMRVQDSAHSIC